MELITADSSIADSQRGALKTNRIAQEEPAYSTLSQTTTQRMRKALNLWEEAAGINVTSNHNRPIDAPRIS